MCIDRHAGTWSYSTMNRKSSKSDTNYFYMNKNKKFCIFRWTDSRCVINSPSSQETSVGKGTWR